MQTGDLVIAADFGTSGVKVGVVANGLHILASTQEPYPLSLPGPSMAEQSPEDWWSALARGISRLAADVPELRARTGALVFCAQMCGLVCANKAGAPLRPSLIWLDKRSAPLMRDVLGGFPSFSGYGVGKMLKWIRIANGGPSLNGMDPMGKMLWVMQNEPDTYAHTEHFMDVKDWLIQRATGEVVTTADSANLTWLMDTRRGREGWSPQLANHVGIALDRLPRIVDGSAHVGGLRAEAAGQLGLRADTPVIAGGSDVTATAIGSGAIADGALHICASTSSWVSGFFDRRILSIRHSYATITSSVGFRPLLIATQESAGSALGWLADALDPNHPEKTEALSEFYHDLGKAAPDDPYFLPWLAGERVPVDEERLRGAFFGLSLRHGRAALKRSVIEGVALNTRWMFSKVARHKGIQGGTIPMVGGAAENPYLVQAMANALNRQIRVGDACYSGVLGAAAMAAPQMGWADTVWQAAAALQDHDRPVIDPQPDHVRLMQDRYDRLQSVRKGLVKLYRQPARKGAAS